LVEYIVQSGDTLPALAARFHTSEEEIRLANPDIPQDATTLPSGMPMQVPIYYVPFWGSPFQIVPDSMYVNGPAVVGFDVEMFVEQQPGWLKNVKVTAGGRERIGGEFVEYVARNFSISPKVLLALLEYQSGALSQAILPAEDAKYPLGYQDEFYQGAYLQLVWAARLLNNGYYGWREGVLLEYERKDGRIERIDPWQNAATVALQYYYNIALKPVDFDTAVGPDGFAKTYQDLFGDPWGGEEAHIPVSLQQPEFLFPWERGKSWAFTGGPHTGWGQGLPLAALDFAPRVSESGCAPSVDWVTALASGVVTRSEVGIVELDLDGDGDSRTGWVVFYLHVGSKGRVRLGDVLNTGDHIGHASCEGGSSSGTHVHVARRYNGEWISAAGVIPFVMEGWVPVYGSDIYKGSLVRFDKVVIANPGANSTSWVQAGDEISGGSQ
jgi:murein DD-endopeptidase MepM/ murein hydrolase activator NlpD